MNRLTKRYIVLHKNKRLLSKTIEYPIGTIVFPSLGVTGIEFDTLEEAEKYILENNLTYESANQD